MHVIPTSEDYWCPVGEGEDAGPTAEVSGREWLALLKVANGDWSIPASDLACLLERRLVEISAGFLHLTDDGRVALGVPV